MLNAVQVCHQDTGTPFEQSPLGYLCFSITIPLTSCMVSLRCVYFLIFAKFHVDLVVNLGASFILRFINSFFEYVWFGL